MSWIHHNTQQNIKRSNKRKAPYDYPNFTLDRPESPIPAILQRLTAVENQLQMLQVPTPHQTPTREEVGTADLASMRSSLVPAMQGYAHHNLLHLRVHSNNSIIRGDEAEQSMSNTMESLSLRRDLSRPENPPFGIWWTYTIEETLLWPVLNYHGPVNEVLDLLFDSSDEEESDGHNDDNNQPAGRIRSSRMGKTRLKHNSTPRASGLDDGDIVPSLIDSFLRNVHIRSPILDPPLLRSHAKNLVENGLGWNGETCQVLLACALGAISSPWDASEIANFDSNSSSSLSKSSLAYEYFRAGLKRLGDLWAHSSLLSAQCFFLTGLFHMYVQEPVAGWRAFNSASITCRAYTSKRIARKARHHSKPESQSNCSMEQRLFWSSFKAEREIGCEFGLDTSGINRIADSSTLPTPPNSYASDIRSAPSYRTNEPTRTVACDVSGDQSYEEQSWYFYLMEIMLCKLEMRIDNFFQDKRRDAYFHAGSSTEAFFNGLVVALQEFDYQLTCYYESLPPVMQLPLFDFDNDNNINTNNPNTLAPCSEELRQYLRLRVFSVRHDICLPALYILLHNDVSRWPRSLVAVLVQLANTCLRVDMNFLQTAITTHRHHTTWLGCRKGVRAALILIAARRLAAQRRPRLEDLYVPDEILWKAGAKTLIQGLRYWEEESRDCARYLDILRKLDPDFES